MFNEYMVAVYLYLMLCLTDFYGENPVREGLGYALMGLVAFTVGVNLVKVIKVGIQDLKKMMKCPTKVA